MLTLAANLVLSYWVIRLGHYASTAFLTEDFSFYWATLFVDAEDSLMVKYQPMIQMCNPGGFTGLRGK